MESLKERQILLNHLKKAALLSDNCVVLKKTIEEQELYYEDVIKHLQEQQQEKTNELKKIAMGLKDILNELLQDYDIDVKYKQKITTHLKRIK